MIPLTQQQISRLAELRAAHEAHSAAWKRYASFDRYGASSATVEQQAKINAEAPFANELRAELQTLEFLSEPARKEFLYPSNDLHALTGFMGNVMMRVEWIGHEFRSAFGDKRRSVRAVGINGAKYFGTIYGTYARLTPRNV